MVTAKQSKTAVTSLRHLESVTDAWAADRGYAIAVLGPQSEHTIGALVHVAQKYDMDGEIRIVPDFMHRGEETIAVHFEHRDRTERI
jgi:hypothetical protein